MKFTFAILTYNQERIIVETLESIKYQIEKFGAGYTFRLIIVDDNSKDRTANVIECWINSYRSLFKSINFIRNGKNQGTVANYNTIMDKIGDEKFKLIAGDDLISSVNLLQESLPLKNDTLSTYVKLILENNRIYIQPKSLIRYFYNLKHKQTASFHLRSLRRGGYLHTPSTIYTKELYQKAECAKMNRQFRLFEDDPTWYSMIKNIPGLKIVFHSKGIVLYRIHNHSVSNTKIKTALSTEFDQELKKLYLAYQKDSKGAERMFHWIRCKTISLPKIFRIEKYIDLLYFWYQSATVKQKPEFQMFAEHLKRQAVQEQVFYNQIKKAANKFYDQNGF